MSFIKCKCNTCNGHIEFEAGNEGQTINCPHCGLETTLYNEASAMPATAFDQKPPQTNPPIQSPQLGPMGFEKLLFSITRFFVIGLAAVTILVMILLGVGFVSTLRIEREQRRVSYEEISVSFMPGPDASATSRPVVKAASTAAKIPKNVEEVFSARIRVLNLWLDKMNEDEQEQFLENMSAIIEKARESGVNRTKMDAVVERYQEIWAEKALAAASRSWDKVGQRAAYISAGFGSLLILTMLSMVLMLSAIERNTRRQKQTF